ncbi:MAG: ABC transporter ATP-binding protein [Chloroflexi bacterium]|nr:ABC transporter ATP-binding protein [Chloroflexota bacterium]
MTASEFAVSQDWRADRRGPMRWILSHTRRHKLVLLGLFGGAFGNAVLAAVMPIFVGRAFDAVIGTPPDLRGLATSSVIVVLSQLVRGVLQLGRNWAGETLSQRLERDIRDEVYVSLLGKSMSFHDMQPSGDLMARATNDVREINYMFSPGFNMVIGSAMFLIVPFYFVPLIYPQLVIVPLLYLVVYFLVVWVYLRELRPATEGVRREFGLMNTRLAEAIEGIETVKGAAQEQREIGQFVRAISGWRDAYLIQAGIEARFIPLLLLGILQAGGLLYSLLLLRAGIIGVGDVAAFSGILQMFRFPTFAAQFAYTRVSSGIASARRVLELINAKTELDQNVAGHDTPLQGEVIFENVTFCYQVPGQICSIDDGETALENVSFRVAPGQTVAIVGQTGSGKSTIAKLINRTYDVDGGRILVDGVDVRDWNMEALRRQISVIEQDIFLFSRTIAENIAFGRPDTARKEIEAAARAAQAHDFISDFKDGYDTVIGERGVTLSGGQRQRLALARAFLTRPPVLVLDDATSAIDSETEDRIQRAIERAAAGRTTFLITHRLSQIRWADLIVVMRKGQVETVGTHNELLQDSAAYRNIFMRYDR